MNISELSERLKLQCETVCRNIFPSGKRVGAEFCVGNVDGAAGDSLKIRLSGTKTGIWSDFATGDSGDLIDLWRLHYGLSIHDTITEIKNYLGVSDTNEYVRKYQPPVKPKCNRPVSAVHHWLINERKISQAAIDAYKIAESGNLIIFPFLFDNKLVMCKQRDIHDKKNQRPTSAEQKPILFGWQAIPDQQRNIFIVEGELDAMALFDYGYPALSVPFGGGGGAKQGNWIENEFNNLDRFEEIYLVMDNDDAGKEATREIILRLGAERCRYVRLPCKDANKCLMDGIDAETIETCIRNAKTLDPDELKRAHTFEAKVQKMFRPDENREPGFLSPWNKAHENILFRYGELTILNGINGHGKSQLACHMILSAMAQGERCCIASMEFKPERLLQRMVMQASALRNGKPSPEYITAIMTWMKESLWIYECTGSAKIDRMLSVMTYARKRYGVKVFLIDSLAKCGMGDDDYNGQKNFVERLCDFKNEFDTHVFLVTHSRKGESEEKPSNKFDVKGTSSITDLADNVYIVWRNKVKERKLEKNMDDQEALDSPDCILACAKQRNGKWEGKIGLWFEKNCFQYLSRPSDRPHEYVPFSIHQNKTSPVSDEKIIEFPKPKL